jgi:hypothetical protein
MKNSLLAFASLLIITGPACRKESQPAAEKAPRYTQLAVGNYWIYEQYHVDGHGKANSMNTYDSVYVEDLVNINGKLYWKVINPAPEGDGISYLRDSAGFIVELRGDIFFAPTDTGKIYYSGYITSDRDTVCRVESKMCDLNKAVITPAGSFNCIDAKSSTEMYAGWDAGGKVRHHHRKWAPGVGLVVETYATFFEVPEHIERRLLRYHIQ